MKSVLQAVKEWWSPLSGQWWRGDVLFPGNNKVVKSVLKVTDLSIELTAQPKLMLYTSMPAPESRLTFSLYMPCSHFYLHRTDMQPISQGKKVESQRGDRQLILRIPSTWKETANVGRDPPILAMHPKTEFRPILLPQVLGPIINACYQ